MSTLRPPASPAGPRSTLAAQVAALARVAALALAGLIGACGSGAAPAARDRTPRATVRAFNADLAQHDFTAACRLVRPFARPLLTDLRVGHSLASCSAGLSASDAPRLITHYALSATQIRTAAVTALGPNLDSLTPSPVPDPVYLLKRVDGAWLIVGL